MLRLTILIVFLLSAVVSFSQENSSNDQNSGPEKMTDQHFDTAQEQIVWEKVKDSQDLNQLKDYLSKFGWSPHATFIRFRYEKLGGNIQNVKLEAIHQVTSIIKAESAPSSPDIAIPTAKSEAPSKSVIAAEIQSVSPVSASGEVLDCPNCPKLLVIPKGEFLMGKNRSDPSGEPDEAPVHKVVISQSLAVGKYEITRGQFSDFVKETGYRVQSDGCHTKRGGWFHKDAKVSWENPGFAQIETHPVVCISWEDTQAYLGWLSKTTGKLYRLPSEAEWEYFSNGPEINANSFKGDAPCKLFNIADASTRHEVSGIQYLACNDGYATTAPVGSFPANKFGLFDTLGNAWEWVADCWNENYVGAPSDGSSWSKGTCDTRVFRGGGWNTSPKIINYAYRDRGDKIERYDDVGFRVVRPYP